MYGTTLTAGSRLIERMREDCWCSFCWLGERYRDEGGLASAGHADHDEADRVVVVFVVRGLLRLLLLLHFVWLVNWLL